MNQRQTIKRLSPYFFISVAGILAFLPVSFMLKALKNDIINLEYPINYFISQCIRSGEIPLWFNTWGMGFPLHSALSWGIYSTPQLLFSALFDYNVYILHIEFMFFVLLAGWGMFYLLRKHFLKDEKIAVLLATSYMLSGFMVGSTQWLLYITAASFIPLLVSSLLSLLQFPSFKKAIQFAVVYTLMLTSVYAAFNIITTYGIVVFLLLFFFKERNNRTKNVVIVRYLFLAGLFIVLLCFPCIYYTLELLTYIKRGNSIDTDSSFFYSNYLHPSALSTMLLPFSAVRLNFANTEGTMFHSYAGLFVLLLFPATIIQAIRNKNKTALFLLVGATLFLLLAFGPKTPIRNLLNVLPGFSYFRHPGIFRLFFITCLILFIASVLRKKPFHECFELKNFSFTSSLSVTFLVLGLLFLFVLLFNLSGLKGISLKNITLFIKNITLHQSLLISSSIQLIILIILFILLKKKLFKPASFLLLSDLVVNTLLCTPYFSVGSYTIKDVQHIYHSQRGFPVQQELFNKVPATYTDAKGNPWNNVNVFSKKISSNDSYRGPLTFEQFVAFSADYSSETFNKAVVSAQNELPANHLTIVTQRPDHIRVVLDFVQADSITLWQNYYPGWSAHYNGKQVDLGTSSKTGIAVLVPPGKATIDFTYKRTGVLLSAIFLHLITISFLLWKLYAFFKPRSNLLPLHGNTDSLVH